MPFDNDVRMKALLWADRHCCLCKKPCGANIEVHHLVPESDGGGSDIDNAIPLCFDCHGHVHHYSERHPVGTKYKTEELRRRREQVYEEFTRPLVPPIHYEVTQSMPNGGLRPFPDVGFVVQHLGATLPVRLKVVAEMRLNGESLGSSSGAHYSGAGLWNLNPQSLISGHFTFDSRSRSGKLGIIVTLTVVDQYDREHPNLPVAWVYMPDVSSWYFEPCIAEV